MYRLFVLRNDTSGCFVQTRTYQSLGIIVVLQHWRIGPEHCSRIEGEPTIQHSSHSSPGFPKHKKQLQRNIVG